MRHLASMVCLATLFAGCDDPKDTAARRCTRLVTVFCNRIAECAEGEQSSDALSGDCEESLVDALGCVDAVEIGGGFQNCLDDAELLECDEVNAELASNRSVSLPLSCSGVIRVEEL